MTPFWTTIFAALYALAGLTVGGVVLFFGALGNEPRSVVWSVLAAIFWPFALLWFFGVAVWRMIH